MEFIKFIGFLVVMCFVFIPILRRMNRKQEQEREATRLAAEERVRMEAEKKAYWPKKLAENKVAITQKYRDSAVVKEIASYLCDELGEKPLKFLVTCDGVQGFSSNRSVTYDFLAHGLSKLSSYFESYVSGKEVPLDISLSEDNKYFLVETIAASINEHLGNIYQVEDRISNYYDYDIKDEDGYFKGRERITTGVSSITYCLIPTRSF